MTTFPVQTKNKTAETPSLPKNYTNTADAVTALIRAQVKKKSRARHFETLMLFINYVVLQDIQQALAPKSQGQAELVFLCG